MYRKFDTDRLAGKTVYGHSIADPRTAPPLGPEISTRMAAEDFERFLARCPKSVVVSLDDGYADNLNQALGLLETYDIRAIVFATTGFIDRSCAIAERVVARVAQNRQPDEPLLRRLNVAQLDGPSLYKALRKHLRKTTLATRLEIQNALQQTYDIDTKSLMADMLTINQLAELDAHPLVTVGAHTVHHPSLEQCTNAELASEFGDSKRLLELWLERSVDAVAYPYGKHDRRVRRAARAAGYSRAFTIRPGKWRRKLPVFGEFERPRLKIERGLEALDRQNR